MLLLESNTSEGQLYSHNQILIFFTFPKALTKDSPPVEPGLLIAETVSWKSLKPGNLVLKIHTYATKATIVRLPVGYGMASFFPY